jgi:hypothetical protein
MSESPHRSFARIDKRDLKQLGNIAADDFDDLFRRNPTHVYIKTDCFSPAYVKEQRGTTFIAIEASMTSTYGVSSKRCQVTRFRIDGRDSMTSGDPSLAITRKMATVLLAAKSVSLAGRSASILQKRG